MATARAATVHTDPLYPTAPTAWTGAISAAMTVPAGSAALPHSLMPLSAPAIEAGGRLAPVVAQLQGTLGLSPAAFAALPAKQRQAALELAVDAAQVELTQQAYELSAQARTLSSQDRILDKDGRAELYRIVSRLDEMGARYGQFLGESERESISAAFGQAARRAWKIRSDLLGVKMKEMGAALSKADRDIPGPLPEGSLSAVKLLQRMRSTKSGWGAEDMDALLTGFGFERREGGKHIVYVHPEFPQLRETVSRQRDLPPGYAQSAIKSIEQLGRLRAAEASRPGTGHAALPVDFKLEDLAVLAAHEERAEFAPTPSQAKDQVRLAPYRPHDAPEPKEVPPGEPASSQPRTFSSQTYDGLRGWTGRFLRGKILKGSSGWTTNRDFQEYLIGFEDALAEPLARLGPSGHVVDMGSGESVFAEELLTIKGYDRERFIREYEFSEPTGADTYVLSKKTFTPTPATDKALSSFFSRPLQDRPHVTAVTAALKRSIPDHEGRLNILQGKLFHDIPSDKIPSADIITDVFGVASYDPDLHFVLDRYFSILKPGGVALFFPADLGGVKIIGEQKQSFVDYLRSIKGLKVSVRKDFAGDECLVVERVSKDAIVFPGLKLRFRLPIMKNPEPRSYDLMSHDQG